LFGIRLRIASLVCLIRNKNETINNRIQMKRETIGETIVVFIRSHKNVVRRAKSFRLTGVVSND